MGHGLQKLNGSFGGPGLEGTEQTMKALRMHPPQHQARAVALSETVGGGLTALGFLSPLGPAMIMGTMAVAIKKVHLKNGLWASNKGYEFNLTLIASSFALAADGPGLLSVDWLLGKQRKGLKWALASAALGAGAALAALRVGEKLAPASPSAAQAGNGLTDEPLTVASARHEPDRPPAGPSEAHLSDHQPSDHQPSDHQHSDHQHSDNHDSDEHGSDKDHSHL